MTTGYYDLEMIISNGDIDTGDVTADDLPSRLLYDSTGCYDTPESPRTTGTTLATLTRSDVASGVSESRVFRNISMTAGNHNLQLCGSTSGTRIDAFIFTPTERVGGAPSAG
jgi:hypothetical protein